MSGTRPLLVPNVPDMSPTCVPTPEAVARTRKDASPTSAALCPELHRRPPNFARLRARSSAPLP